MKANRKTPDHDVLYHLAESQAGYFTARQALGLVFPGCVSPTTRKTGTSKDSPQGIYRLSRFPSSRFEDLFVAWLKCGPESAISHESPLASYDLSDVLPTEVHVTVPRTACRRRKGIQLHTNRLAACRSSEARRPAGYFSSAHDSGRGQGGTLRRSRRVRHTGCTSTWPHHETSTSSRTPDQDLLKFIEGAKVIDVSA